MRKEVFLAIAIGFAVGIVITFGIWTANKSLKNLPKNAQTSPEPTTILAQTTPSAISPTPTLKPTSSTGTLIITSPTDDLLTDKSTIVLSGKTTPSATVAIIAEKNEYIVSADKTGTFSADIALDGGYNTITVTSVDSTGATTSQTITVTLSSAKI